MSEISHCTYKFVFDNRIVIGGNDITQLWNDIYDLFYLHYEMYIQRNDGREMNQIEIRKLRDDIFEDMDEDFSLIDSQYKNKKLYFWNNGEFWSNTHEENIENIISLYEEMGYKIIRNDNDSIYCDFFVEKGEEKKAILCRRWFIDEGDVEIGKPDILKFLNSNIPIHEKLIINFEPIYEEIIELINNNAEFKSTDDIRNQRNWYISKKLDEDAKDPYFIEEERYDEILLGLINEVNRSKTNNEKKISLEKLGSYLFNNIDGFHVEKENMRSSAEESDLLVSNENDDPFFEKIGSPILVECRNVKKSFSAKDARDFKGKISNLGLNSGVIISKRGLSGKINRDAKLEIRDSRKDGVTIISLEIHDIEFIANGADPLKIMKKKYYDLFQF